MQVDEILTERAQTHGKYSDIVATRAIIMRALEGIYIANNHDVPNMELQVMWNDLVLKLVRSAANPEHRDSWLDLEGYAHIINEVLEEQDDVNSK